MLWLNLTIKYFFLSWKFSVFKMYFHREGNNKSQIPKRLPLLLKSKKHWKSKSKETKKIIGYLALQNFFCVHAVLSQVVYNQSCILLLFFWVFRDVGLQHPKVALLLNKVNIYTLYSFNRKKKEYQCQAMLGTGNSKMDTELKTKLGRKMETYGGQSCDGMG